MRILLSAAGAALVLIILIESFEIVILPRTVKRRIRLTVCLFRASWRAWSALICNVFAPGRRREAFLSFYGPLSLLLLLVVWASVLVTGFALMYYSLDYSLTGPALEAGKQVLGPFARCLYYSATTFFTLGLGDILPKSAAAMALTAIEAALGLGFLAIFISFLPPLNQFFYKRETHVSILAARVGSPPAASEILDRHIAGQNLEVLHQLLYDWEIWAGELHESHLSYPVLAYFRSQHEKQSWLMAITAILDTCGFIMSGVEGACKCQAELTFAMCRHTVTDLCLVFDCPPEQPASGRLQPAELARLRARLTQKGLEFPSESKMESELASLRSQYEPYVYALAERFHLAIPPWIRE